MAFLQILKNNLKKFDQLSPYPLLYPFIMSKNEIMLFDRAIQKSQNYLEFGFGGSTLRALQKSKTKVYTVESSVDWINYMRKYKIVRIKENKRLFISYVDIGMTGEWGYPTSNDSRHLFPAYSSDIFKQINTQTLDLVLVDGRFRVACTLKTIHECHKNKNNLKILIHDFWNRPHYHILLKYLDTIDRVDTIGLFSIKNNIDLNLLNKDYEMYKTDPN